MASQVFQKLNMTISQEGFFEVNNLRYNSIKVQDSPGVLWLSVDRTCLLVGFGWSFHQLVWGFGLRCRQRDFLVLPLESNF